MAFRFNLAGNIFKAIKGVSKNIKLNKLKKRKIRARNIKAVEKSVEKVRKDGVLENLGRVKLSRKDVRKTKPIAGDPASRLSHLVTKYHALPEHSPKRIKLRGEITELAQAIKDGKVSSKYDHEKLKKVMKIVTPILGVSAVTDILGDSHDKNSI